MKHALTKQTLLSTLIVSTFALSAMAEERQSWMFMPGHYSHDPQSGDRVAQFAPDPEIEALPDARPYASGYKRSRTSMRGADGTMTEYIRVDNWGNGRGGLDAENERYHEAIRRYYPGFSPIYGNPGWGGPGWGGGWGAPGWGAPGYGAPGYGAPGWGGPGWGGSYPVPYPVPYPRGRYPHNRHPHHGGGGHGGGWGPGGGHGGGGHGGGWGPGGGYGGGGHGGGGNPGQGGGGS